MKKIILLFSVIACMAITFGQGVNIYPFPAPASFNGNVTVTGSIKCTDTLKGVHIITIDTIAHLDSARTRALNVTGSYGAKVNGINIGTSKAIIGTTSITLGNNTQSVAVNSSGWDVDASGNCTSMGTYNSQTISSATNLTGTATIAGNTVIHGKLQIIKDGDTTTIDPSTSLYQIDIRNDGTWKIRGDTSGNLILAGTLTSTGAINGLTIANAIPSLVTTATAATDTTSAGAKLSSVTQFVTVTSGGAGYKLMLPAASSSTVGMVIRGYVGSNGFMLRVAAAQSGTVYLNNTVTNKQAAIPATSIFKVECISATGWVVSTMTYAGAAGATITPAQY